MNVDARITAAIQQDAPPPRDPVFRYQVLERAERRRFRRRSLQALAGAAAVGVVSVFTLAGGAEAYTAGGALLVALTLVSGAVVVLPDLGRLLRHLSV